MFVVYEVWKFFGDWKIIVVDYFFVVIDMVRVVYVWIVIFWFIVVVLEFFNIFVFFEVDWF